MKLALFMLLGVTGFLCGAVREESITHAGVKFRVVKLAPERVSLVWKNSAGIPYRNFGQVQASIAKQGKNATFLMNAGIFEPGGIPSGLHVENRKQLHPINLADAPGNFFLKPNGVMWIESGDSTQAHIATPQAFLARQKELQSLSPDRIEFAVQSGPLLLIDGKRHPAFNEYSTSKLHRNGVGVNAKNQLVFAITEPRQLVNFWDFSGLFLKLGCNNALFLDGDISKMSVNPTQPIHSPAFGAIFIVTE